MRLLQKIGVTVAVAAGWLGMVAGTVHASEPPATVSVQGVVCTHPVGESRPCHVPVRLSRALASAVTVHFATRPGTATGEDFVPVNDTTVRIPAGATSGNATVVLRAGAPCEPDKQFAVELFQPTAEAIETHIGLEIHIGAVTIVTDCPP